MSGFTEFFVLAFFLAWFLDRVIGHTTRDSSDQMPKGKRSGLIVRTDYGTGVQYLESPFGGLTPRLDADGKPTKVE